MPDYKIYKGQLTTTTPVILEIESDLFVPGGFVYINDGPGAIDVKVKLAGNGEFVDIDAIPTSLGEIVNLSNQNVVEVELTLQNSKYPANYLLAASIGGDVGFSRDPRFVEVYSVPWYRTNEQITSVQEYEGITDTGIKISYTVPADRELYIESLTLTVSCENNPPQVVQWEADGVGFFAQSLGIGSRLPVSNTCGGGTHTYPAPIRSPLGPFTAGQVITAERVFGDTDVPWAAHMVGYLEVV